jgi:GTP-binding protein EngB required for normal cell division
VPLILINISCLKIFCIGGGGTRTEYVQDPALIAQLERFRQDNARLAEQFAELNKRMEEQQISSFEDLAKYDEKAAKTLIKLATATPPAEMSGRNFAFFGMTSTGKSTMINKLLGKNIAATGVGETTREHTAYQGVGYTLYDIPGRNDDVSYFSLEYVGFWKGLTRRLVLVRNTIKEMTKVFHLLDAIGLRYDIIVNKFDSVDFEERETFKQQIHDEIKDCKLQGVDNVWFLSSRNPQQFPDWVQMVHCLTDPSKDQKGH